jgi:hypothetical protein
VAFRRAKAPVRLLMIRHGSSAAALFDLDGHRPISGEVLASRCRPAVDLVAFAAPHQAVRSRRKGAWAQRRVDAIVVLTCQRVDIDSSSTRLGIHTTAHRPNRRSPSPTAGGGDSRMSKNLGCCVLSLMLTGTTVLHQHEECVCPTTPG